MPLTLTSSTVILKTNKSVRKISRVKIFRCQNSQHLYSSWFPLLFSPFNAKSILRHRLGAEELLIMASSQWFLHISNPRPAKIWPKSIDPPNTGKLNFNFGFFPFIHFSDWFFNRNISKNLNSIIFILFKGFAQS